MNRPKCPNCGEKIMRHDVDFVVWALQWLSDPKSAGSHQVLKTIYRNRTAARLNERPDCPDCNRKMQKAGPKNKREGYRITKMQRYLCSGCGKTITRSGVLDEVS